jgi:hypothetical protein
MVEVTMVSQGSAGGHWDLDADQELLMYINIAVIWYYV